MAKLSTDRAAAEFLAGVGEPTRLAIIRFLADGTKNVGEIAKAVERPIVNVSHHLGVLREAGLVEDRKDGRFMLYTLCCVSAKGAGLLALSHEASGLKVVIPL